MIRNLFEGWHFILVLVIIFLLFGATRLPGVAKSLGESLKIFKKELKELNDDGNADAATTPGAPATPTTPAPPAPSTDGSTVPGTGDPNHPAA